MSVVDPTQPNPCRRTPTQPKPKHPTNRDSKKKNHHPALVQKKRDAAHYSPTHTSWRQKRMSCCLVLLPSNSYYTIFFFESVFEVAPAQLFRRIFLEVRSPRKTRNYCCVYPYSYRAVASVVCRGDDASEGDGTEGDARHERSTARWCHSLEGINET